MAAKAFATVNPNQHLSLLLSSRWGNWKRFEDVRTDKFPAMISSLSDREREAAVAF